MLIFRFVRNILQRFGLEVRKKSFSPYEYLRYKKRFFPFKIKLLKKEFFIPDALSFYYSYKEIFLDEIYRFRSSSDSPFIIDLGSNIGTSIIYFKSQYPNSKIIGVEADPSIYKILKNNIELRRFEGINLINKAVSESESKSIKFYQEGADGGRTFPIEGKKYIEIPSIELDTLINEEIDFLKIDIEGAETEVIMSSKKLDKVKNIFIEYHSFFNTEQSLDKILKKLTDNGFKYIIHTQFAAKRPFIDTLHSKYMDLQLNIFAKKN